MTSRWPLRQWIMALTLSFLSLVALLVLMVGITRIDEIAEALRRDPDAESSGVPSEASNPAPAGEGMDAEKPSLTVREVPIVDAAVIGPGRLEYNDQLGDEATYPPRLLSLDPHNALHGFVVLPLLAGLLLLCGAGVIRTVLERWPGTTEWSVELLQGRHSKAMRERYVLLGLAFWVALSVFLILDLAGSISLRTGFVALYGLGWVVVGLLLLYSRPLREKVVILTLFLVALCSVRFVDWNTRKPFLRALDRVTAGITEAQADEIMDGYIKGMSPTAQVDDQGGIDWGTVSYRHTTEAWGNTDIGVLIFQDGRVVRVEFLPD